MQIFLPIHWPKAHHVTLTNNGLLMGNVVQLCLAANNILLIDIRNRNHAFLLLAIALT